MKHILIFLLFALTASGQTKSGFNRITPKPVPVRILAILDTNSTLRGRTDKLVTNITLTAESGVKHRGWIEHSSPTWREWRFGALTNCTNVILHLIDIDGLHLRTNLIIGPQPSTYPPYTPPVSPGRTAPAGLIVKPPALGWSPASSQDPWFQILSSNWSYAYDEHWPNGYREQWRDTGSVDNGPCQSRGIYKRWQGDSVLMDCRAEYSGPAWMLYLGNHGGICQYFQTRPCNGEAVMADYRSDALTINRTDSEVMTFQGTSRAVMHVGTWNTGSNAVCFLRVYLYEIQRRWANELDWPFEVPADDVMAIGGFPADEGDATISVPDGSTVDVTPTINRKGWIYYEVGFQRMR